MATRKRKRTTDVVADLAASVCDLREKVTETMRVLGSRVAEIGNETNRRLTALEESEFDRAAVYRGHTEEAPASSANVRPDAAKEHALRRWWEEDVGVPTTRQEVSMPAPDYIEKLNKALNGNFAPYEVGTQCHPDLLTLSAVSRLEKKVDALDRAVRFLVERTPAAG